MTVTPRERSDEQVRAAAKQIDVALSGGLTEEQMVALIAARHAWTALGGQLDPTTICPALIEGVQVPAAQEWDALFVRRARSELSVSPSSVTP